MYRSGTAFVNRISKAGDLDELGHICRKNIFDRHIVKRVAVVFQDLFEVRVTVLHLLIEVAGGDQDSLVVHADGT